MRPELPDGFKAGGFLRTCSTIWVTNARGILTFGSSHSSVERDRPVYTERRSPKGPQLLPRLPEAFVARASS